MLRSLLSYSKQIHSHSRLGCTPTIVHHTSFSTSTSFHARSKMAAPTSEVNKTAHPFERSALEGLLIKRFFFCPAFEIYGGKLAAFSELERRLIRLVSLGAQQVSRGCSTM